MHPWRCGMRRTPPHPLRKIGLISHHQPSGWEKLCLDFDRLWRFFGAAVRCISLGVAAESDSSVIVQKPPSRDFVPGWAGKPGQIAHFESPTVSRVCQCKSLQKDERLIEGVSLVRHRDLMQDGYASKSQLRKTWKLSSTRCSRKLVDETSRSKKSITTLQFVVHSMGLSCCDLESLASGTFIQLPRLGTCSLNRLYHGEPQARTVARILDMRDKLSFGKYPGLRHADLQS